HRRRGESRPGDGARHPPSLLRHQPPLGPPLGHALDHREPVGDRRWLHDPRRDAEGRPALESAAAGLLLLRWPRPTVKGMLMAQQHTSQHVRRCTQEALAACEKLLEEKNPITSYEPIAEMTRCLVKLRDQLIREQQGGASVRS